MPFDPTIFTGMMPARIGEINPLGPTPALPQMPEPVTPFPQTPQMPQPQQKRGLLDILPMILPAIAGALKGRAGMIGATQGTLGGLQMADQRRMEQERQAATLADHQLALQERQATTALNKQKASAAFLDDAMTTLKGINDPVEWAQYRDLYEQAGTQYGLAAPGTFRSLKFSDAKAAATTAKEAQDLATKLQGIYADKLTPQTTVKFRGKDVPFGAVLDMAGWGVKDESGQAVMPGGKKPGAETDFDKKVEALRAAKEKTLGRPLNEQERVDVMREATRLSQDPALAGLAVTNAELSATLKRLQISQAGAGGNAPDVDAMKPDPAVGNKVDNRTGLTPNALYQNAVNYALTGRMPSMGMGGRGQTQAARMAIQNKAGAIATAAGTTLPALQADYAANSKTLAQMLPKYSTLSAYSETASKNLGLALEQSAKVGRGGAPKVNRFTQWFTSEMGGRQLPELSKFELYVYSAAREYAKVTSGAFLSASELSQTAAQKADELVNAAQSPEQFKAVAEGMQADMDNVTGPWLNQIQNISGNIAGFLRVTGGSVAGSSPVSSGAGRTSGSRLYYDDNGNPIRK